MPIEADKTQAAIDQLLARLPAATARVSFEMAEDAGTAARMQLQDPLGPLAESIQLEGSDQIGDNAYQTKVGPTLVYGRQRELGGPIDPVDQTMLTAAHRAPGYWMWDYGDGRGLRDVFTPHVFQVGQHYLKRGVEIALPTMLRTAFKIWSDMIRRTV